MVVERPDLHCGDDLVFKSAHVHGCHFVKCSVATISGTVYRPMDNRRNSNVILVVNFDQVQKISAKTARSTDGQTRADSAI